MVSITKMNPISTQKPTTIQNPTTPIVADVNIPNSHDNTAAIYTRSASRESSGASKSTYNAQGTYTIRPETLPDVAPERNKGITVSDIESGKKILQYDPKTTNSPAVATVQKLLTNLGYSIGNDTNGTYGKGTEAAVTKFQKENPNYVKVSGQVGNSTITCLKRANQTAQNYKTYGKPLGNLETLKSKASSGDKTVQIDAIARTLYGECTSTVKNGQEAVAWTIINRDKTGDNNKNYTNEIFAKSQYTGLTGEYGHPNGNPAALAPDRLSPEWQKALDIAKKVVNGQFSSIPNPIGDAKYFRSSDYFKKNSRTVKGQQQMYADKKWNDIKDVHSVGGNVYFTYGKTK